MHSNEKTLSCIVLNFLSHSVVFFSFWRAWSLYSKFITEYTSETSLKAINIRRSHETSGEYPVYYPMIANKTTRVKLQ